MGEVRRTGHQPADRGGGRQIRQPLDRVRLGRQRRRQRRHGQLPRTPRPAARHRHEPGQRPLVARRHQGRRPHLADGRAERLGPLDDQPRVRGRTARTDQPPAISTASSRHASTDAETGTGGPKNRT